MPESPTHFPADASRNAAPSARLGLRPPRRRGGRWPLSLSRFGWSA